MYGRRDRAGEEAVLSGRKQLVELLRSRPHVVRQVILQSGVELSGELSAAIHSVKERGIPVSYLEAQAFQNRVAVPVHQGVAALITPREPVKLKALLDQLRGRGTNGLLLVLDEVSDPQNLGALLRVAETAGVDGVVMTADRSSPLTPVARRVSVGASEFVPIALVKNLQRGVNELREHGFWIVGTVVGGEGQNLYSTDIPHPVAIVVGSEGKGLRKVTRGNCDLLVEIPMRGKLESLNVSQAAAVVLFELVRRSELSDRGRDGLCQGGRAGDRERRG